MLEFSFDKLVFLGLIAVVLIGPRRLPVAAASLGRMVRSLRGRWTELQKDIEAETGIDPDEWKRLDPRQYDPRRIVREALSAPLGDTHEPRHSTSSTTPPDEAGSAVD